MKIGIELNNGEVQMNPIVKRFNKTNNNYKLNFADSYGYLREELRPKNRFYLTDKQGNFPSEFDVGEYGYKCFDIFPLIEALFIECFGKGTSFKIKNHSAVSDYG